MAWDIWRDDLTDQLEINVRGEKEPYEPDVVALREAEDLLLDLNIAADAASIQAVAETLWTAKIYVADLMIKRAAGDYSLDPKLAKLATMPARAAPASPQTASMFVVYVVKPRPRR